MHVLSAVHTAILAAPTITPVNPPFLSKITTIAGWVMVIVGLALVLAFAVGLAMVAWAKVTHGRAASSAGVLGVVLACGMGLGSIGAIMNGVF